MIDTLPAPFTAEPFLPNPQNGALAQVSFAAVRSSAVPSCASAQQVFAWHRQAILAISIEMEKAQKAPSRVLETLPQNAQSAHHYLLKLYTNIDTYNTTWLSKSEMFVWIVDVQKPPNLCAFAHRAWGHPASGASTARRTAAPHPRLAGGVSSVSKGNQKENRHSLVDVGRANI